MGKQKVTLRLEAETLGEFAEARARAKPVGSGRRSRGERVASLKHLAAVDAWLAELGEMYGPVPPETTEWAAHLVDDWEGNRKRKGD